jgi:hypothetical protein
MRILANASQGERSMSKSRRLPLLPIWTIALLAVALAATWFAASSVFALPQVPPTGAGEGSGSTCTDDADNDADTVVDDCSFIDNLSFDLNTSGNTATSVGTVQNCVEASVGTTVNFDLVVHPNGIPTDRPFAGIQFNVLYDQTLVNIVDVTSPTAHYDFLLGSGGSPTYIPLSDGLPDSDGSFAEATGDIGANAESGDGVLVRLGAQTLAAGVATLSIEGDTFNTDDTFQSYQVLDGNNALIPVDPADVHVGYVLVSQTPGSCNDDDGDGEPNFLDADDDNDGVADGSDLCAATASGAPVDSNGCSDAQVDPDGDGLCSPTAPSDGPSACTGADNCPNAANAGQEDLDGDLTGDACDSDIDGDSFTNDDEEAAGSNALDAGSVPESEVYNPGSCSDGEDNDNDGLTDSADSGCEPSAAGSPTPTPILTPTSLPDGLGGPGAGDGTSWILVLLAGFMASSLGAGALIFRAVRRASDD